MAEDDVDAIRSLIDAQSRAEQNLNGRMGRLIRLLLPKLGKSGWYQPDQFLPVARQLSAASIQAQKARAALTAKYTQLSLRQMGVQVRAPTVDVAHLRAPALIVLPPPEAPVMWHEPAVWPDADLRDGDLSLADLVGPDPVQLWERPIETYRWNVSQDVDPEVALERAIDRAESINELDLQLADRRASQHTMAQSTKVIGHRRVIHPERSQGGTCGLCIAASQRFYYVEELREIHGNCKCTAVPILSGSDIGRLLNTTDLEQLYREAGGNDAQALKFTRYQINEHGELGPVITREGQQFRDQAEVIISNSRPAEISPQRAAALRDNAIATLNGLLQRQAAGEELATPIKYQRGLVSKFTLAAFEAA